MATRSEVTAAIESQPTSSAVMVCDGKGTLLASRSGHGDSAVLLLLDSDLAERIAEGFPWNARPEQSPKIVAALKKRAKAERARNRKAKQKQTPPAPTTRASRGLCRRPTPDAAGGIKPSEPARTQPPEETGEFRGIEVI